MRLTRSKNRRGRGALAACLGSCALVGCWGTAELITDTAPAATTSAAGGDPTADAPTDDTPTGDVPPDTWPDATTGGPPEDACVAMREQARAVLTERCGGCHLGPGAQVFDYVDDLDHLVVSGKVKGGDPEGSQLYQLVEQDVMPKTVDKLTPDEKLTIKQWISQCTVSEDQSPLDPPACPGTNAFISTDQMLGAMAGELGNPAKVAHEDQPFVRFFTLTHLWNAGYCDAQIEAYRHALAKLLNSLSNRPTITLPVAVDAERTMYRIDLRDYGWDADLWELLVVNDPFAVEYLQDSAEGLKGLTGTKVPFQFADWFVTDASQAPLYDQILYERVFKLKPDIFAANDPLSRADLEAALGVAVDAAVALEADQDPDQVARAGFQLSGVSAQNRIVERHDFPDNFSRSYWLSHDFLENVDKSNIFYHPLDFTAAGGEIIWTLPNGLQGYMLVDALGDRIDEADIEIVSNKEENGEPIINGMSCMSCHYQGMRAVQDEIRKFVDNQPGLFDAPTEEKIFNLYPPQGELDQRLKSDGDVFAASVAKTGAPLLIAGHEVTRIVYRAFEDVEVDLVRAAAEIGLPHDQLLPKIGQLPDGLKMINGGFVNRDSMRKEYAVAICNLKLGITKACTPG